MIWQDIYSNFKAVINGVTNVTASFSEATDCVSVGHLPSSIFDGKFSIQLNAINSVRCDVNYMMQYDYLVRVEFAFETYELNDNKIKYNSCIKDIEQIIYERLQASSWANSSIDIISLNNVSQPVFLKNDNSGFMVINCDFNVIGRKLIN